MAMGTRARQAHRVVDGAASHITFWPAVFSVLRYVLSAAGALIGYLLAQATPPLARFAPVSYYLAALLGVLLIVGAIALVMWIARMVSVPHITAGSEQTSPTPTTVAEDDDGMNVLLIWKTTAARNRYCALITATKRATNPAVVARYALVYNASYGPEWRWGDSKRIFEKNQILPSESFEVEIIDRRTITVDHTSDTLRILDTDVDLTNHPQIEIGAFVLMEVSAISDTHSSTKRTMFTFQRCGSRQIVHTLDQHVYGYIKDYGAHL